MKKPGLMRDKRFAPLFWTQFLGSFNDNLLKNALVILIAFRTSSVLGLPSSQMVAVSGAIFILPFFLFSATAGQLADKVEKTILIRWIKLIEIGIMVVATYGFLTHQFPLLLGVLFLMGLHSTFFGPIKYSILPELLGEDELVTGNAAVESGTFLAILTGTIVGGSLAGLDPAGPTWISALLLAVAVGGWWTSQKIPAGKAGDPGLQVQWNPFPPTWEIYQFIKKNRTVYLSVLGISWFWFFGTAFLSLFPPYCKDVLHGNESLVTLFLAIFSIGIGVGSMLCERLSRQHLELGLVPFGSIGMTLFSIDLFLIGSPSALEGTQTGLVAFLSTGSGIHILIDLLLIAISGGFFIVPLYTLIQERTEKSHRSRVVAGNNILNAVFMVVASVLILGMMAAKLSIPQMFLVVGTLNAAIAIYIYTLVPEFLLRFVAWILANILYRLRVTGLSHIPHQGAAVLVCNHVSFADWLIISAAIKRPIRFVMDHNYAKGWLGRVLERRAKVIPIAPAKEGPEKLEAAFERIAAELREGELICIFPEGKITSDGKINPFRPGIEKIIARSPVPVIPMALQGLWGSFFSREGGAAIKKRPKRFWSRIQLDIAGPVSPDKVTAQDLFDRVSALRKTP